MAGPLDVSVEASITLGTEKVLVIEHCVCSAQWPRVSAEKASTSNYVGRVPC